MVKEQAQQNLQLKAIRVCPGGSAGTDIGFVQISAHPQGPAAPPPPPETFGPNNKKTEESARVLIIVHLLIADLDKEATAAEVEKRTHKRPMRSSW